MFLISEIFIFRVNLILICWSFNVFKQKALKGLNTSTMGEAHRKNALTVKALKGRNLSPTHTFHHIPPHTL